MNMVTRVVLIGLGVVTFAIGWGVYTHPERERERQQARAQYIATNCPPPVKVGDYLRDPLDGSLAIVITAGEGVGHWAKTAKDPCYFSAIVRTSPGSGDTVFLRDRAMVQRWVNAKKEHKGNGA